MSNLERAIEIWVEALQKILTLLLEHPENWDEDVWNIVLGVHNALTVVATALTVMFFLYGMSRKSINLTDLKRPEIWFTQFLRLGITVGVVAASMSLMKESFAVVQGILRTILGSAGTISFEMSAPEEVITAINNQGIIEFHLLGSDKGIDFTGLWVALYGLLSVVIIFVCAIMLLVITWGRFFNLYIHMAVAGIFLSSFASEHTQNIGVSFIRSWLNACFRAVIILLALIIYSELMQSDTSEAVQLITEGDVSGGMLLYMKEFLVGALVTIGICKAGDQIAQRWGL